MRFFMDAPAKFTAEAPPVKPSHKGCWLDGSHLHPDDFSRGIISMAITFGANWVDETDLEAYNSICERLDQPSPMHGDITDQESEFLREASDEAVTWLTLKVAPEDHVFYVEESDLFLDSYGNAAD